MRDVTTNKNLISIAGDGKLSEHLRIWHTLHPQAFPAIQFKICFTCKHTDLFSLQFKLQILFSCFNEVWATTCAVITNCSINAKAEVARVKNAHALVISVEKF